MKPRIWMSPPHMGGAEEQFVHDAFVTNWIAPLGPNVDGFEQDLEQFLGAGNYVAALSSGTAALHLGLVVLGIKPGDEVICQSMTFVASANPIAYLGATPVFVDSEADTWNMSPTLLEAAIKDRIARGKKPKAIIVVHLYGMPAKMQEILAVAAQHGIPVLEDAAEALGSSVGGQLCGTFGDISVLSFNGNKIITTSGGGAAVARSNAVVKEMHHFASQARDPAPYYQHSQIGYNYRLSNLCAGVGRGQMQVLPDRIAKRRSIYDEYAAHLAGRPGISFLPEPAGSFSNRWLTTLLIDPAAAGFTCEDLRLAFEKENIESRPLWKPMHQQPVFQGSPFYGNGTSDALFAGGLCLPSGTNMSPYDMARIFTVLDQLINF